MINCPLKKDQFFSSPSYLNKLLKQEICKGTFNHHCPLLEMISCLQYTKCEVHNVKTRID